MIYFSKIFYSVPLFIVSYNFSREKWAFERSNIIFIRSVPTFALIFSNKTSYQPLNFCTADFYLLFSPSKLQL